MGTVTLCQEIGEQFRRRIFVGIADENNWPDGLPLVEKGRIAQAQEQGFVMGEFQAGGKTVGWRLCSPEKLQLIRAWFAI
jgi:hypothetical protein